MGSPSGKSLPACSSKWSSKVSVLNLRAVRCVSVPRHAAGGYLSGIGATYVRFRMSCDSWGKCFLYTGAHAESARSEYQHYAYRKYHDTGDPSVLEGVEINMTIRALGRCLNLTRPKDFSDSGMSLNGFLEEWETHPPGKLSCGQELMAAIMQYNDFMIAERRPEDVICAVKVPSARHAGGLNIVVLLNDATQSAGLEIREVGCTRFTLPWSL